MTFPNRYLYRVDGAIVDEIPVYQYGGVAASGSMVALNASGYVDPSLIYSIAGGGVTSVNASTGALVISGGFGVQVSTTGQTILISASGMDVGTIGCTIDGGGSPPSTGIKAYIQIPFNCLLQSWTAIADVSGSMAVDIWFSGGPAPPGNPSIPTSGNKISASAGPSLSSARSASSTSLGTWSPILLTQWGTLVFNLSSATTVTRIIIQLQVIKL